MKRQCRRAYVLAAELTGVSQLIALLVHLPSAIYLTTIDASIFRFWSLH
jgi:hypothetical protein